MSDIPKQRPRTPKVKIEGLVRGVDYDITLSEMCVCHELGGHRVRLEITLTDGFIFRMKTDHFNPRAMQRRCVAWLNKRLLMPGGTQHPGVESKLPGGQPWVSRIDALRVLQ
jgi:hypothetical protein